MKAYTTEDRCNLHQKYENGRYKDTFARILDIVPESSCAVWTTDSMNDKAEIKLIVSYNRTITEQRIIVKMGAIIHLLNTHPDFVEEKYIEKNLLYHYLVFNNNFVSSVESYIGEIEETTTKRCAKVALRKISNFCNTLKCIKDAQNDDSTLIARKYAHYMELFESLKDVNDVKLSALFMRPLQDVEQLLFHLQTVRSHSNGKVNIELCLLGNDASVHEVQNIVPHVVQLIDEGRKSYLGLSSIPCTKCHNTINFAGLVHRGMDPDPSALYAVDDSPDIRHEKHTTELVLSLSELEPKVLMDIKKALGICAGEESQTSLLEDMCRSLMSEAIRRVNATISEVTPEVTPEERKAKLYDTANGLLISISPKLQTCGVGSIDKMHKAYTEEIESIISNNSSRLSSIRTHKDSVSTQGLSDSSPVVDEMSEAIIHLSQTCKHTSRKLEQTSKRLDLLDMKTSMNTYEIATLMQVQQELKQLLSTIKSSITILEGQTAEVEVHAQEQQAAISTIEAFILKLNTQRLDQDLLNTLNEKMKDIEKDLSTKTIVWGNVLQKLTSLCQIVDTNTAKVSVDNPAVDVLANNTEWQQYGKSAEELLSLGEHFLHQPEASMSALIGSVTVVGD